MDPLTQTLSAPPRAKPADPQSEAMRREALRAVATEFEAVFIAEMLQHTGLGRAPEAFGGGAGEEAFRSRLTAEQGRAIAQNGGLGVADSVYRALLEREGLGPDGRAPGASGREGGR